MASDERDKTTVVVSGEMMSTPGEPRFTPGAIIGNRYRIVSLLGEGGMGEVYRADDLKLGQRVALKYLPPRIAADPRALERMKSEVRIGRNISHPNICRIYDIVDVDGSFFISMEYVDGEDLASLLRRIGRLPADKALALMRDLCSGLAAAHDRGVVHRDLKPANVMVDGEGRARIMDFGLAALVQDLRDHREVAGTPAYMAPEQLVGQEVTPKTDVYALGLILYEMFTGKQVFSGGSLQELLGAHSLTKTRPSSLVREIDPAVEKLILRCVEEEPESRPASVHALLASLPGGNALKAAVDAGQTPSPALVAAEGGVGDLPVARAWTLLVALVAAMLLTTAIDTRWLLTGMVPDIRSRDALRDRAREILGDFGYPRPSGQRGWYGTDVSYLGWLTSHGSGGLASLSKSPPSAVTYTYRSSPSSLVAARISRIVWTSDPAESEPGMSTILLDHAGRLRRFQCVPPENAGRATSPFDWARAFSSAGFDIGAFARAAPLWTPPYGFDDHLAWTGTFPGRSEIAIRVEAASLAGRPVYFDVIEPWDTPAPANRSQALGSVMFAVVTFIVFVMVIVFARRNLARGRGDRRGALRLGACVAICVLVGRGAMATHTSDLVAEWSVLMDLCALALWRGATVWLGYLAVEPYVRRQWPRMLISTNRILAGRLTDPLVGKDILAGGIAGTLMAALADLQPAIAQWLGVPGIWPSNPLAHSSMASATGFLWQLFGSQALAIIFVFSMLAVLIVSKLVLRSYIVAMVPVCICGSLVFFRGDPSPFRLAFAIVGMAILLAVLHRFGAFAATVAYVFQEVLSRGCLTFDFAAWYAMRSIGTLVFLAGIAIFAFRVSLAGKPVMGSLGLDGEPAD